jgi:predicted RNA-binding Zn-ribbon protein involved in translation (DUF1610 family)
MTETSCARFAPGDWVRLRSSTGTDPADAGEVFDVVLERRPLPTRGQVAGVMVSWGSFSAMEQVAALVLCPVAQRDLVRCPYCRHRRGLDGQQWRCPRCGAATPLPESRWESVTMGHTGGGRCDACHGDSLALVPSPDGWSQVVCRRCRARGPRSGVVLGVES